MSAQALIRLATRTDLDALCALENQCFDSDRLSRRSFTHFIKAEHSQLLVAELDQHLCGYVLLLFRKGTNLARIYSIAISVNHRGQGIATLLMSAAEETAIEHDASFIRLEVSKRNTKAARLYQRLGYHKLCDLPEYYEDGSSGERLEKRLHTNKAPSSSTAYYPQTTPFTCGPASLMMAMAALRGDILASRSEELRLWREATTIYMTSGHGGCSPVGLACSAVRRGFDVELYLSSDETPFVDSVRNLQKQDVIRLVHREFLSELAGLGVVPKLGVLTGAQLAQRLRDGQLAVCLVSTWRLNRNKAPHWVLATGADKRFIYFSDPDREEEFWNSDADFIDVPIAHSQYESLARYGKSRFSATLLIS